MPGRGDVAEDSLSVGEWTRRPSDEAARDSNQRSGTSRYIDETTAPDFHNLGLTHRVRSQVVPQ